MFSNGRILTTLAVERFEHRDLWCILVVIGLIGIGLMSGGKKK